LEVKMGGGDARTQSTYGAPHVYPAGTFADDATVEGSPLDGAV
jgi:hypothetical protein